MTVTKYVLLHRYDPTPAEHLPDLYAVATLKFYSEDDPSVEGGWDKPGIWTRTDLAGTFIKEVAVQYLVEHGAASKPQQFTEVEDEALRKYIKHYVLPIEWQRDWDTDDELRSRVLVFSQEA